MEPRMTYSAVVSAPGHGPLVSFGAETLIDLAKEIERNVQYYRSVGRQDAEPSSADVHCAACGGSGQVYRSKGPRRGVNVKCQSCRGRGLQVSVLDQIQCIRFGAKFFPTTNRIAAELIQREERSRRFSAAYDALRADGKTDIEAHSLACLVA